jgi:hypothetical protein
VIVYLLTILLAGSMTARVVLIDVDECDRMARRMISHDPKLTGARWTCEALPMIFASLNPPPQTPSQELPGH